MNQRPLSPHLQVWRWGPHMLVSILHRATGDYADAGRDSARAMASIVPPITPPAPAAVLPVSGLPVALPAPACPPADGAGGALYHEETT